MDNIIEGRLPTTWPYDHTLVDFSSFVPNWPSTDPLKTSLIMNDKDTEFGMWKNARPDNNDFPRNCFCQRPSIPGNPEPPGYPEIPANELCERNWIYLPSSKNCIYHDIAWRAWKAAEDNCVALGGHLVSVNSPDIVSDLLILGADFYDPTSIDAVF